MAKEHEVNERIRAREIRLIDEDGSQLGVVPLKVGLEKARERNLDLVKVAANAKPPVCKIMDYGKFKYEQAKREREAKKNQKTVDIKEIRMSPTIEEHDFMVKVKSARKFLDKGDKVKVSIRFRGRQITHKDLGHKVLERLTEEVKDLGAVESRAKMEGRNLILLLAPKSS